MHEKLFIVCAATCQSDLIYSCLFFGDFLSSGEKYIRFLSYWWYTTERQNRGIIMREEYYKEKLNKEQFEAVTKTEGPVLILAGAGSGKTRTIIHRVAYLVDNGIPPENILLLTFTNKAADEMKQRAVSMSGDDCGRVTACTYHSFCARMLRIYHGNAGLIADFSIITNSDGADIISRIKAEKNYNRLRMFPKSSVVISLISSSVNRSIPLKEVLQEEKYFRYRQYEAEITDLAKSYDE